MESNCCLHMDLNGHEHIFSARIDVSWIIIGLTSIHNSLLSHISHQRLHIDTAHNRKSKTRVWWYEFSVKSSLNAFSSISSTWHNIKSDLAHHSSKYATPIHRKKSFFLPNYSNLADRIPYKHPIWTSFFSLAKYFKFLDLILRLHIKWWLFLRTYFFYSLLSLVKFEHY